MEIVTGVIGALNTIISLWLVLIIVYQLYISFFGFHKKSKDYADHDPQLRYLVLVPAHNEETVIGGIIENLKSMDYPEELYDFYIIADHCSDRTAEVARGLGANVIEISQERPGEPTGKPIALQKALQRLGHYGQTHDLVMFFDADNLIDLNMFREVNSQFLSHPEADIVQCYLGCKNKKGLVALFYYTSYTITNRFFQYAKSRIGINSVIGGTGFAVKSAYLEQRGGWTAMSLTEDFELQVEATCEGKRILWNQNVRVYDEKPTHWGASFRQRTRWAQGHWFVCFKNTRRIIRAYREKRIGFGEFLSTFLYVYSLLPCILVIAQLALSGLLELFRAVKWIPAAVTALTVRDWALVNLPSVLVFLYCFIVLFYVADRMDNGVKVNPLTLFPILLSLALNSVLVFVTQVWGLLRHRRQNVWVKTAHRINDAREGCLYEPSRPSDAGRRLHQMEVIPSARAESEPAADHQPA
ncbi:MAG: glycosyltransferase family 2 protein [Eubacteriales bacterium]|nr:glycosyltransferase family 2 protein [Eubacteriales bacterium]